MDYNRVQSYIKAHVLPKLDSLPQDVQSVKNAFDAWKADWTQARAAKLDNLDATISSRASSQAVDGVQGGVDTTLTKLATLEGSVKGISADVMAVKNSTVPISLKHYSLSLNTSRYSVTGSGYILALSWIVDSTITIDGKVSNLKRSGGSYADVWSVPKYCVPSVDGGMSIGGLLGDSAECVDLSDERADYLFVESIEHIPYVKNAGTMQSFYSLKPQRFEDGFVAETVSGDRHIVTIYTLDPT